MKKVMQNRGGRVTAIPVICTEELLDVGLHEGTVNAATFQEFMTEKLCPNLCHLMAKIHNQLSF